jgi:hypothetical protein
VLVFQTVKLTSDVKGVTAREWTQGLPPVWSAERLTALSLLRRAGRFEGVYQFAALLQQGLTCPES